MHSSIVSRIHDFDVILQHISLRHVAAGCCGTLAWFRTYMGVVQNYFAWGPPSRRPIAIQSRSHRVQSRSNVGHRCRFCFKFRRLISSAGLPLYNWKKEGSDVAQMGRGSLVELVQSPSNRRIRRRNFGLQLPQACLALNKPNQHSGLQRKLFLEAKSARRASAP